MSRELELDDDARPTWRIDGAVWGVAFVLLLGSYGFERASEPPPRTVDGLSGAVSVRVPGGWAAAEIDGVLSVEHPSLDGMPPTVQVQRLAETMDPMERDLAVTRMEQERAEHGVGYRVLHVEESEDAFGGNQATMVWWAMAQDPPGARAGDAVLPRVVEGVDALVTTPHGEVLHVEAFEATHGIDVEDELREVLAGVRVVGGSR